MRSIQCVWELFVHFNEKLAYKFARRTYITKLEILLMCALVGYSHRESVISMRTAKNLYEQQRLHDASSFSGGYVAGGNAYEKSFDDLSSTSWPVLWIIYKPLMIIILLTTAVAIGYLVLKYIFFTMTRRATQPKQAAIHATDHTSGTPESARGRPSTPTYSRLPLEEALDIPIRAATIIRNQYNMEVIKDRKLYIRPSCYLDFGVMLKHGQLEMWRAPVSTTTRLHVSPPPPNE